MHTQVLALDYEEAGVRVRARVPASVAGRVEEFSLKPVAEKRKKRTSRKRDVWTEEEGGALAGEEKVTAMGQEMTSPFV